MEALTICLLGSPSVRTAQGELRRPRGNKAWWLLSYLLLTPAAPSRHVLASLAFPDVDDPLGALRWNIAELRRLLGSEALVEGDPVRLCLPAVSTVDAQVVLEGVWTDAIELGGLGEDLLAGIHFDAAAGLELWLTNQRTRLTAASVSVLHEATLACMAEGRYLDALDHATRLVSLSPFDEGHHVLYVQVLRACGETQRADQHVESTVRYFRDELGEGPSTAFRTAAGAVVAHVARRPSTGSVAAQLEAGEAAIAAGAWEVGLDGLRTAAAMSEQLSDGPLRARVSLSLGSALVHAARGFDEEGAAHLHRAVTLAGEHGPPLVAATASRELAYVELLRGRYERARRWLESAALSAGDDDGEMVWIAAVRGACETDVGSYPAARSWLELAAERARRSGVEVPGAFAFCFLGRYHLMRGELDDAHAHLSTALEMARRAGWTSFVPFPLSLMGEVCRLRGDIEGAGNTYEHAFEMSCRLGDPCWESLGARGLGLVAADRGDAVGAMAHLRDAPVMCRRFPDSYLWIEAFALEAACRVAVAARDQHALVAVRELESLAVRTGMRELAARALLHRAVLGDLGARQLAGSAVAQIDNPALSIAAAPVLR